MRSPSRLLCLGTWVFLSCSLVVVAALTPVWSWMGGSLTSSELTGFFSRGVCYGFVGLFWFRNVGGKSLSCMSLFLLCNFPLCVWHQGESVEFPELHTRGRESPLPHVVSSFLLCATPHPTPPHPGKTISTTLGMSGCSFLQSPSF